MFSFVYNLPRFWEISWKLTEGKDRNITEVEATSLRQNPLYIEVYINWMYMIFMYIIPFGFLALFNILIFKEVRRANSLRAQLTRVQKREIGLAMMLFCVVISFFLCNSLALVVSILELMGRMLHPLTQTSNLLVTFNSSINFIIYCIFGEKFKRMLIKILLSILGKEGLSRNMELMRYPDNSMGPSQFNNERSPYSTGSTLLFRTKSKNQINLPSPSTDHQRNISLSDNSQNANFTRRSIRKINNDLSGGGNHHKNSMYRSLSFCDNGTSLMCDKSKLCDHGLSKKCGDSKKVLSGNKRECGSEESKMLLYPISENNADITITVMVQTCNQDSVCSDMVKNNKCTNKKWKPVKSTAF